MTYRTMIEETPEEISPERLAHLKRCEEIINIVDNRSFSVYHLRENHVGEYFSTVDVCLHAASTKRGKGATFSEAVEDACNLPPVARCDLPQEEGPHYTSFMNFVSFFVVVFATEAACGVLMILLGVP